MSELATARKFEFIAGNLALDFCNTVGGKRGVVAREYLVSYTDFAAWAEQAGILPAAEAEQALRTAAHRPQEAAAVLARAAELREALFRIFAALSAGKAARETDLGILNAGLSRSLGRLRLAAKSRQAYAWDWSLEEAPLDQALGPIAWSAANLLTEMGAVQRVRMCQGDTCGWLFIDASRNHSRCWCDMRDCGNRAKVRRHRQKHRRREQDV